MSDLSSPNARRPTSLGVPVDLYDPIDLGSLRPRPEPYWMALYNGRALGVIVSKRTQQPAYWTARIWIVEERKYSYRRLGPVGFLTVHEARTMAERWFVIHERWASPKYRQDLAERRFRVLSITSDRNDYTVAHALNDYLDRHGPSGDFSKTEYATAYQVHRYLGDLSINELTTLDIERWQSATLAVLGAPPVGSDENPLERVRKRKATLNRQLALLRAALTRAFQHRKIDTDAVWRRVPYFKNTQAPAPRPIDPAAITRFRNNCSRELLRLVDAALYTGCRAVELRRLNCRDLIHESRKLFVPPAKRSAGRAIILSDDGFAFFSNLTTHHKGHEYLVRRQNGRRWTKGALTSQIYRTAKRHPETASINFHALRHTYATRLRDGGMPLNLIAKQLGHKHLRTTEHYYVGIDAAVSDSMIRDALGNM